MRKPEILFESLAKDAVAVDNSRMQNLDTLQSDSVTLHLASQVKSFSSTKLGLKQRYMQDFLKDLKLSEEKSEGLKPRSSKEILFEEIKGMLADF